MKGVRALLCGRFSAVKKGSDPFYVAISDLCTHWGSGYSYWSRSMITETKP